MEYFKKMFKKFQYADLNESVTPLFEYATPEPKDIMRINDIIRKAAGNETKEIMLATNMAKAIKDSNKMERRYIAAMDLLGADHVVTKAFSDGFDRMELSSLDSKDNFVLVTRPPSKPKKVKSKGYSKIKREGAKYISINYSECGESMDKLSDPEINFIKSISAVPNLIIIYVDKDTIIDANNKIIPVTGCYSFDHLGQLTIKAVREDGYVLRSHWDQFLTGYQVLTVIIILNLI
jgi:hypothetical protein